MKRVLFLVVLVAAAGLIFELLRHRSTSEKTRDLAATPTHQHDALASAPPSTAAPIEVQVFGTVRSRGKFRLSRASLADALAQATPTVLSDLKKIRITRFKAGARVKDIVVDAAMISDPAAPAVILDEGDSVFVPEKII
jgi:hypothetical protein